MKNYKIIMLGPSGSGKTVFLASMYKKLSVQRDFDFFLEVEGVENKKRLNSIYMEVATGEKWPRGTRYSEVSEWNFTCRVQTENLAIYSACQFTYLDYAGGRLTDVMEELEDSDSDFHTKIKQADVLLGLLDGQKVAALMHNEASANVWIERDLSLMLQEMQLTTAPIHFVISKWDLIESKLSKFSLEQVRERLLEIDEFKFLVRLRSKAGSSVRLIPVSSVGMNFAIPQTDGGMKKVSGSRPQPFQVEMPLACVLPDKIRLELNQIKEKREAELAKKIQVNPNFNFWDNLCLFCADSIKVVREWLPEKYQFSEKILQRLIELVEVEPQRKQEEAAKLTEQLRLEQEATLKAVRDEETALTHAITSFLNIENTLDYKFPASKIRLLP